MEFQEFQPGDRVVHIEGGAPGTIQCRQPGLAGMGPARRHYCEVIWDDEPTTIAPCAESDLIPVEATR